MTDENRIRVSIIEAGLSEAGYVQVTIVDDITGIAARIAETRPDVIVIDLSNLTRDMLENMFQLARVVQRPIAMFVDRSDTASIEAAVEAGVSAYVVDVQMPGEKLPTAGVVQEICKELSSLVRNSWPTATVCGGRIEQFITRVW